MSVSTKTMSLESLLRRAPVCGVAAIGARRQILMNASQPRDPLGNQQYQSYSSNQLSGNENSGEMYSEIRRGDGSSFRSREKFVPPRRPRMGYGATRNVSDSFINLLKQQRRTESVVVAYSVRVEATIDFNYNVFPEIVPQKPKYRRHHGSAMQLSDSRMEGSSSQESDRATTPDPWMLENTENRSPSRVEHKKSVIRVMRPEDFGLDNAYAKHKDIRGIIFLSMSLCGRRLTLNVQDAAYFRNPLQTQIVSSYVSAVLIHRPNTDTRRGTKPDECYRTCLVTNCSSPSFDESFHFTFAENCARDYLIVNVYEMDAVNSDRKKVLGCMSFPVSRILKKASQMFGDTFQYHGRREPMEEVEINNEGYFLLNKEDGRRQNFPQRKVRRQTFYEDPAFTGTSSAGSSVMSIYPDHQMTAASPRMSVPNDLTMGDFYRGSSTNMHVRSSNNLLDYSSASSSTNGSSDMPEKLKFHRATLPSITTTTSENNSDDAKSLSPDRSPTDHNFLCPDDNGGVYGAGPTHSAIKKNSVRRAASFTFSPKASSSKTNLRHLNGRDEDREKKRFLGPISRTLSYLRSKMDLALSTSSLYPSREDVRQWETSFESLLNNKFGCALFRQFLKKEFSDENMDFWLECEEFKKMKDGKKSTTQKAIEIYSEFVAEHSPKEVNLDSDTRAATRAAVEGGCKPDTFALAQNRVEQLMSKDSYRRFLRDRLFLDLLESYDSGDKEDKPSSSKERN
uniref:C2 domain-containing protein n=1 Tax=Caenorhabditis tropicalis TaxID=1561998 RepID=A0A1I7UPZ7_9PELO